MLSWQQREHWPKEDQCEVGTKGSRAGEEGLGTGKENKGLAAYDSLERNQFFPQGYFGKEFQLKIRLGLPLDPREEKIMLPWDPGAEL